MVGELARKTGKVLFFKKLSSPSCLAHGNVCHNLIWPPVRFREVLKAGHHSFSELVWDGCVCGYN